MFGVSWWDVELLLGFDRFLNLVEELFKYGFICRVISLLVMVVLVVDLFYVSVFMFLNCFVVCFVFFWFYDIFLLKEFFIIRIGVCELYRGYIGKFWIFLFLDDVYLGEF